MPDTSPIVDNAPTLIGGATLLLGGLMAYLRRTLATKAKDEHPITHVPEAAGVAMTLIDQATQAEIARDTKRTVEVATRGADTLERVEKIMREFIEDAEQERLRKEKEEAEARIDKVERENRELRALVEDARRSAGPYTTQPRK